MIQAIDEHPNSHSEAEFQEFIDGCISKERYYRPLDKSRGIDWVRADLVLKDLFRNMAGLDYRKTTHSVELARWLVDNDPTQLADVAESLAEVLELK